VKPIDAVPRAAPQPETDPMNTHASAGNTGIPTHATSAAAATAPADPRIDEAQSLRALLDDIETLLLDAGSLTTTEFERLRAAATERLAATGAGLSAFGSRVGHEATRQARRVDSQVHAQPWPAIGLGALLGVAVGVLIARQR
jgi:ElaB/YqjD/DUF883 family membrane-anchored ribosome-binding protein